MTLYDELIARGLIAQVTNEKRQKHDQQRQSHVLHWL